MEQYQTNLPIDNNLFEHLQSENYSNHNQFNLILNNVNKVYPNNV